MRNGKGGGGGGGDKGLELRRRTRAEKVGKKMDAFKLWNVDMRRGSYIG